jgi:hypothetical protein
MVKFLKHAVASFGVKIGFTEEYTVNSPVMAELAGEKYRNVQPCLLAIVRN